MRTFMTDITTSPASTMMFIRIPTMATHAGSLTASTCIRADAGSAAKAPKRVHALSSRLLIALPLPMRSSELEPWTLGVRLRHEPEGVHRFVVAPGADPDAIHLQYEGANRLSLNRDGDLLIHTRTGDLIQHRPVVYQTIAGEKKSVDGRLKALEQTFDRYFYDWRRKRSGELAWSNYTPYEIRIIGAFVRLGRRDAALELLRFFLADRRPPAQDQRGRA